MAYSMSGSLETASNSRFQISAFTQSRKRVKTLFQWPNVGGRSRQGLPCDPQHSLDKPSVILAAAAGIARLAKTKRLHLRPLGVSQNESVHPKLESQPSPDENPESQQTLVLGSKSGELLEVQSASSCGYLFRSDGLYQL